MKNKTCINLINKIDNRLNQIRILCFYYYLMKCLKERYNRNLDMFYVSADYD